MSLCLLLVEGICLAEVVIVLAKLAGINFMQVATRVCIGSWLLLWFPTIWFYIFWFQRFPIPILGGLLEDFCCWLLHFAGDLVCWWVLLLIVAANIVLLLLFPFELFWRLCFQSSSLCLLGLKKLSSASIGAAIFRSPSVASYHYAFIVLMAMITTIGCLGYSCFCCLLCWLVVHV